MDRKGIIAKAELIEEIWELKNKSRKLTNKKTLGSKNASPPEGGTKNLPAGCLMPSAVLGWPMPLLQR